MNDVKCKDEDVNKNEDLLKQRGNKKRNNNFTKIRNDDNDDLNKCKQYKNVYP